MLRGAVEPLDWSVKVALNDPSKNWAPVLTSVLVLAHCVNSDSNPSVKRVLGADTHCPVTGSQASVVQALPSSQTTGVPEHRPSGVQVSPVVQALPSSQAPPGVGTKKHSPSRQNSVAWPFLAGQRIGVPALLRSGTQVSPRVQASPSSQVTPGVGVKTHWPFSQASAVQGF